MEQLLLDFFSTETFSIEETARGYFTLGFNRQMTESRVVSTNIRSASGANLYKKKMAQFFLPLRSQSYVKPHSWAGVQDYLEKAFNFVGETDTAILWDKEPLFASYQTSHTLDSVVVDGRTKNQLAVSLFISRRQSTSRSNLNLFSSYIPTRIVLHLVFDKKDLDLQFNEKASFVKKYTYTNNQSALETFTVSETIVGISLPWLLSFFKYEKLHPFFNTGKKLPSRVEDGFIKQINNTIEYFLFDMLKPGKKEHVFDPFIYLNQLLFKNWLKRSPFLSDLLDDPEVLRNNFVTNIYQKSFYSFNPTNVSFKTLVFSEFITTAKITEDPYYPKVPWAVHKTIQWWKNQRNFFTVDDHNLDNAIAEFQTVLRNVCMFYEMYHKYFSGDLTAVDEMYPVNWVTYMFYTSQLHNNKLPKQHLHIKFWLNAALRIHTWTSTQKMRRIFLSYWQPYSSDSNKPVSSHIFDAYSEQVRRFSDIHVLLDQIYGIPHLLANIAEYVDWRNITTPHQVHDKLSKYITNNQYPNNKLTNPIYDNLLNADLNIPYTTLKIVIARDTATVRAWGKEQNHCIAGYADRINQPQYLLFGVWDTAQDKWFGHCCLQLQTHADPKQQWREYQFLGHSNKGLPAESKKVCLDFLLETMYPTPPKKEEEQTVSPKAKSPKVKIAAPAKKAVPVKKAVPAKKKAQPKKLPYGYANVLAT